MLCQPLVIITTSRGCHVYFFTEEAHPGRILAGRYAPAPDETNGRKRLVKFIETLGTGRQVVSAGSRHPSGKRYRFPGDATYADIPTLMVVQYWAVMLPTVWTRSGALSVPKNGRSVKGTPPLQRETIIQKFEF